MTNTSGFREILTANRQELLANLGAKFDTLARLERVAEDDQAQIEHDEFISLRLNRLDYEKLRLVSDALARLDRGEFGLCLECGEPIARRRLEVVPWARHCVRCEEETSRVQDDALFGSEDSRVEAVSY